MSDISGLSVNVGESQIAQSLKLRDLGVTFDQFLNFDDHITAICRSTYFHFTNIGKLGIHYRIMFVLLLFMHLLVVIYIIVIPYCITFLCIKLIAKTSEAMCTDIDKINV